MTNEQLCNRLNDILAHELSGAMMYLHYSFFIYGHARIPVTGWLRSQSSEGMTHATLVGDKIISRGGKPVTHPAHDQFPTSFESLDDMLMASLELEKKVYTMYSSLLDDIDEKDKSMRFFLEQILTEEAGHIEEIELMLRPDVVK